MRKKALTAVLFVVILSVASCAYLCKTSPQLLSNLDVAITTLKAGVDQLQIYIAQLQVYDPIIELAYAESKVLLQQAMDLQKQKCPAEAEINAVTSANYDKVQPLVNKAHVRAAKLGLKK